MTLFFSFSHRHVAVRTGIAEHLKQVLDKVGADTIFSCDKVFTKRFLVAVSKMAVDAAADVRLVITHVEI